MTDFARFFCVGSTCWLSCESSDSHSAPIIQEGHCGVKRSIDVVSVSIEEDEEPTPTELKKHDVHSEVRQPTAEPFYVVQKNGYRESVQVSRALAFNSYFSGPYRVPLTDNEGKRDVHAQQDPMPGVRTSTAAPSGTTTQNACFVIHDEETVSSIFRSCNEEESSTQQYNVQKPGLVIPDTKGHNYHIVQRC